MYYTGIDYPVTTNTTEHFVPVEKAIDIVGCRYHEQSWCINVPKIYLSQYAIALLLIAIGYPISSVMCYSIYSKILGPNKQVYIYLVS